MSNADYSTLRVETHAATRLIVLTRADQANAQNMAMINELDDAFDHAGADDEIRVVVLAAEGKHFSAGHDLKELVGADRDPVLDEQRSTPEGKFAHERQMYFDRCIRIRDFPKPTIAAVQGSCVAAGLMLASMFDLIVAADDAVFQNPVARMTGMGVELLVEPWELGPRKAKEFLLTGGMINAEGAQRLGLVNRVVPRDELTTRTLELAAEVALVPPVTARHIKDSINHMVDLQGQRASWQYHFMSHHFVHNTATARGALDERNSRSSMKEVFADRDRGDAPPTDAPSNDAG